MSCSYPGERPAAASAQGEEGHEHDAFPSAVVDDVLVAALSKVVVVLDRRDRHDLARALDLLDADLRQADVPDLPAVPVFPDRGQACFERRLWVDPVEVVERDGAGPKPAKTLLDLRAKHVRASFARSV